MEYGFEVGRKELTDPTNRIGRMDRESLYHSAKIYKDRTKRWKNKRIKPKEFKSEDKVLLFNSRVKLFGEGKLRSKWKGPYTIVKTSSHRAVTLQVDDGKIFKVND